MNPKIIEKASSEIMEKVMREVFKELEVSNKEDAKLAAYGSAIINKYKELVFGYRRTKGNYMLDGELVYVEKTTRVKMEETSDPIFKVTYRKYNLITAQEDVIVREFPWNEMKKFVPLTLTVELAEFLFPIEKYEKGEFKCRARGVEISEGVYEADISKSEEQDDWWIYVAHYKPSSLSNLLFHTSNVESFSYVHELQKLHFKAFSEKLELPLDYFTRKYYASKD